jgi:hypothetical protein
MATVDISDKVVHQSLRDVLETQVALQASATVDPASIADGDELAGEITVTGAALGDFVLASFSLDLTDVALTAAVTAANTVTWTILNNTGGAIDLAEGTLRVRVLPFGNLLTA